MMQSTIRQMKVLCSKYTIVRSIRSKPTKPALRSSAAILKSSSLIADKDANSFVDDPIDKPNQVIDGSIYANISSSISQQQGQITSTEKTQWNWVRPSKATMPDEIRLNDDDVIPVLNGLVCI